MFEFIIVFIVVLFFYIHIYHHIKTSNDLEIYDIPFTTRTKLDEICDIRQPTVFKLPVSLSSKTLTQICDNYGSFDVSIGKGDDWDSCVPIPLSNVMHILSNEDTDSSSEEKSKKYISENNSSFLQETNIIKEIQKQDALIRPSLVSSCDYDMIVGNVNSYMCMRYHKEYRTLYTVHEGCVTIRLIPPSCSKYVFAEEDYGAMRFISPMNCWDIQPEYVKEFRKVKSIDIILKQGDTIYIPAYWWYSISFHELSCIWVCKYQTWMSMISIIPTYIMSFLQRSNIQHDMINKKVNIHNDINSNNDDI